MQYLLKELANVRLHHMQMHYLPEALHFGFIYIIYMMSESNGAINSSIQSINASVSNSIPLNTINEGHKNATIQPAQDYWSQFRLVINSWQTTTPNLADVATMMVSLASRLQSLEGTTKENTTMLVQILDIVKGIPKEHTLPRKKKNDVILVKKEAKKKQAKVSTVHPIWKDSIPKEEIKIGEAPKVKRKSWSPADMRTRWKEKKIEQKNFIVNWHDYQKAIESYDWTTVAVKGSKIIKYSTGFYISCTTYEQYTETLKACCLAGNQKKIPHPRIMLDPDCPKEVFEGIKAAKKVALQQKRSAAEAKKKE